MRIPVQATFTLDKEIFEVQTDNLDTFINQYLKSKGIKKGEYKFYELFPDFDEYSNLRSVEVWTFI